MPPFAGTPEEVEAVAQLLRWEQAGAPARWPDATARDPAVRARIRAWLDEAGIAPAGPQGARFGRRPARRDGGRR